MGGARDRGRGGGQGRCRAETLKTNGIKKKHKNEKKHRAVIDRLVLKKGRCWRTRLACVSSTLLRVTPNVFILRYPSQKPTEMMELFNNTYI